MMLIKGNIDTLKDWSRRMLNAPEGSTSTEKYGVFEHDGYGYVYATKAALHDVDIDVELVPNILKTDGDGNPTPETHIQCVRCEQNYLTLELSGLCINCTASETQPSARKKRRGIIDRLVIATQGTQLENVVMSLRQHYAVETAIFEETGNAQPMLDAIEGESDQTISAYLAIEFTNASNVTQSLETWIINELQS